MLEQEGSLVWLQDNDLGWIGGTVLSVGKTNSNKSGGGASELKVVDERGYSPKSAPRVNRNDCHQVRPVGWPFASHMYADGGGIRFSQPRPIAEDKVYIKFKRVVD